MFAFPASRLLLVFLLGAVPFAAGAQEHDPPPDDAPPSRRSLDGRLVRSINQIENPAFAGVMRAADWSSIKTFYSIAPVMGAAALLTGSEADPSLQMLASEVATVGLVFGVKWALKRPRPYATWSDVEKRTAGTGEFDPYSFPSGHAAMAFTIATSLSLGYPKWYVIAPSYLWATSIAVSRNWLGVHYPSDVLAGAAVGTGMALGVFLIFEAIESAASSGDSSAEPLGTPPAFTFRIAL